MIIFFVFFAIIFFSYPKVHSANDNDLRKTFFSYLRGGFVLPLYLVISLDMGWLNFVLAGSVLAFWMSATYGVMEINNRLEKGLF